MSYVNKQASLLSGASRTAEVSGLKQSLERTEEELGLVKRQLEEIQGIWYPAFILMSDNWFALMKAL